MSDVEFPEDSGSKGVPFTRSLHLAAAMQECNSQIFTLIYGKDDRMAI